MCAAVSYMYMLIGPRQHFMVIHRNFGFYATNKNCKMTTGCLQSFLRSLPTWFWTLYRLPAWGLDFTSLKEMNALNLNEGLLALQGGSLSSWSKHCVLLLALVLVICIHKNEAA